VWEEKEEYSPKRNTEGERRDFATKKEKGTKGVRGGENAGIVGGKDIRDIRDQKRNPGFPWIFKHWLGGRP